MLVRKKMSAKKSAIYLAIIFFMIGGAGLMMLQNRKLTLVRPVNTNLSPAVPGAPLSNALAITGVNNQAAAITGPAPDINSQNIGSLNLNIFSSDKFKNLLANIFIAKEPAEVGKIDPFKPN